MGAPRGSGKGPAAQLCIALPCSRWQLSGLSHAQWSRRGTRRLWPAPTVHEVAVAGLVGLAVRQHIRGHPLARARRGRLKLADVLFQNGVLQARLQDGAGPVRAGLVACRVSQRVLKAAAAVVGLGSGAGTLTLGRAAPRWR